MFALLLFADGLQANDFNSRLVRAKKLKVVATLPVLGYLAREVGGAAVRVQVLSNALQDPHFVSPKPTLMKKLRGADALIEVGLGLELWAQKLVESVGNAKVQRGAKGRIVASNGISTLEMPKVLTRAMGDVHPEGNPHVWLDPIHTKKMVTNIRVGLCGLAPRRCAVFKKNEAQYHARIDKALFGEVLVKKVGGRKLTLEARLGRLEQFLSKRKLTSQLGGWFKKAFSIKNRQFVTYHKTFTYFAKRFGFDVPITIEEKPGITPSAKHRDLVVKTIQTKKVPRILMARFYDKTAATYIAKKTGVQIVATDIDLKAGANYFDYIGGLFDALGK